MGFPGRGKLLFLLRYLAVTLIRYALFMMASLIPLYGSHVLMTMTTRILSRTSTLLVAEELSTIISS